MSANEIPSAFPMQCSLGEDMMAPEYGMSLRDWFAGQAANGILSGLGDETLTGKAAQIAAAEAYTVADAMLAQRAIPPSGDAEVGR